MRVVLSTQSTDRGSTSRTLEAWARLLPSYDVAPTVTVGGEGPLLSALRQAGVPTIIRPLRVLPHKLFPFPFAIAVARLVGTIRAALASLIHVNEHDHHPMAAEAARWSNVPIVTHIRFRPTADYCRWLFKRGRVPRRVFFTSQTQLNDSADALRPFVPENRWRVIPNGLDSSRFGLDPAPREALRREWGLAGDAVVIGTACAISRRKRIDHFIRLIARLRHAGVDAHGIIAGRTYFRDDEAVVDELHRLAAGLKIESAIRFLGYVEPSEPLYHAWDICVSTSLYETFGMTVLEAMGCACPVVSYPGGSIAEIVGTSASIVSDGDEDALLAECHRLARDPSARIQLGKAGRAHAASTYDIRTIVPLLAHEYHLIMAEARDGEVVR